MATGAASSINGKNKTIQWAINAQGNALAFLDRKAANDVIRGAMNLVAGDWVQTFLPKRFTDYVDRDPFPYPGHRLGFFINKARRMGVLKQLIDSLPMTKGWDPWGPDKPDLLLIIEWKRQHPGKYNRIGSGPGLISDMRRNAKDQISKIIDEMWGKGIFQPLVESGLLRKTVMQGVKFRSTVTANSQKLYITMPIPLRSNQEKGKGGISPTVGAVLRTVPHWEISWFAKKLERAMAATLMNKHLLRQDARGMVTALSRNTASADSRSSNSTVGR